MVHKWLIKCFAVVVVVSFSVCVSLCVFGCKLNSESTNYQVDSNIEMTNFSYFSRDRYCLRFCNQCAFQHLLKKEKHEMRGRGRKRRRRRVFNNISFVYR